MKHRIAVILLALLILSTLSGCASSGETAAPVPEPAAVSESLPAVITESISPSSYSSGETMPEERFEEAYLDHMIGSMHEPTAADTLRSVYAKKVSITVIEAENGSAEITLTTPCLAAIMEEVIGSHLSADVTTANILNAITDVLASGSYATTEQTVTVSYTEVDGLPVIEETEEYINALYGGLLDLAQEQQALYEAGAGEDA